MPSHEPSANNLSDTEEASAAEAAEQAPPEQAQGVWAVDPSPAVEEGKMPRSATLVVHFQLDLIERLYGVLPEIGSAHFIMQVARVIDDSWINKSKGLDIDDRGVVIAKNFRRPRQKKYRVDLDAMHVAMLRVALRYP